MLAVRTFVFVVLMGNAEGGRTWWGGLVEEFLESGQCLDLEFDEVVEFFVVLHTDGIDKFCSGLRTSLAMSAVKGVMVSTWLAMS